MAEAPFTEEMAKLVLASEATPTRFERFCIDLFSAIDGVEYVPTSASYDLGRDGRSIKRQPRRRAPFILCSLRSDIEAKAIDDVKKLVKHAEPGIIRFCSNQKISEKAKTELEQEIGRVCTSAEVHVEGIQQIAAALVGHPEPLGRWYMGEIESLRQALVYSIGDEKACVAGMRIALTTQLTNNALQLREDTTRNLALTALCNAGENSLDGLARSVSEALHLRRPVHADYLRATLDTLCHEGLVEKRGTSYAITEIGNEELREREEAGARSLLHGRELVRKLVGRLAGQNLTDEAFAEVWRLIQAEIASMFLENGTQIVEAVASIAEGSSTFREHPDVRESIEQLGKKVAALGIGGEKATAIGRATADVFYETQSDAFRWLTTLCSVYVTVCSLGLEPRSQEQIVSFLMSIELLLDTDVVLSFLSEGEHNHRAVRDVVDGWHRIEGRVCVAPPVLEEASYHAWMSDAEYDNVWQLLSGMEADEVGHLIATVFVRGFWHLAASKGGGFEPRRWRKYIGFFKGTEPYDYQRIAKLLVDDGIDLLSEEVVDEKFARKVADHIVGLRQERGSKALKDKSRRDGQLVALLATRRGMQLPTRRTTIVVSSSRLLRSACNRYSAVLGSPDPILPIGAVAYMLAFVPGSQMTLDSLREVLFDPGFAQRLPPLQKLAMHVIAASDEYSLAWSNRAVLRQAMQETIVEVARQRGQKPEDLESELEGDAPENVDVLAKVIAESVDSLAASKSEKETERLRRMVKELKSRGDT